MASIKTSIMLHDGMSSTLRHINSALLSTVNAFEQMQSTASQGMDTQALANIRRDLSLADHQMQQYEDAIRDAQNAQNNLNGSVNQGASTFKKIAGTVMAAVGAYISFQQVAKLVDFSGQYSNTTARIAMMNDGLQTTAALQSDIYQAAQNSLASYADTATMVTKLGNNAASAFTSSKEIIDFAELIQKQFSIAGTGAVEASNATLQLTQALGSGVLRGDELNSIFEQAPNIIQNIAKYLDVPIGSIRAMAKEGELTAQIVKESMFAATDDINKNFSAMPFTWSDIWTTMVNYAQNKAAGLALRISDFFNSETFMIFQMAATKSIDVVVWGLNLIIMVLSGLANWVAIIGRFFVNNWSWIAPTLILIAVVLGSILTILVAKYTWLGLVIVATKLWTAAQWAYNTAALANPTTWIIIGIIAAIALVVYATVVWGEQTASVIGFIVGLFAALGAFIVNMILNLANALTSFAEFFINLFIDPTYAVKKLFYDMVMIVVDNMGSMASSFDQAATTLGNVFVAGANIAIGAVNGLIGALNMIPGIEIGTISKLSAGANNIFTSQWKSFASNLKAPTSSKDVISLGRAELLNIPDVFSGASDWAYDGTMTVSNSMNGILDKAMGLANYSPAAGESSLGDLLNGLGLGKDDYMNGLNDALNGLNDAAKDTAKMADSANLTKDDIAYLREKVAGNLQNINKNTNIKVDMKNENHINNELDIDGVIDRFGERVEEVAEILSEGDALV